ncbi:MAG TPA: sigma-70 family RNA polymerase sigma factor [Jiangellaceae bacterium]
MRSHSVRALRGPEAKGADPLMTLLDDSYTTDPGLVAEVRMGRPEAFGELYRRYYSGALRYALSMTRGDEPRAQDIVSEAFTRVFRAMSRNIQVAAFWPYLLASVRNAHRAELRRYDRVDLVERADDLDELVAEAPSMADLGQDDSSVHAAFRRLPPRWRTVLWRSEICGDTASEIGQDLGISANAAAALASRAREGLRVEYLRDHLTYARASCRPYAELLAKLVRGVLGRRDRRRVEAHIRGCSDCARTLSDLTVLNGKMRSVLPLILGVGPLLSAQGLSSAPAGGIGSGIVGSAAVASGSAGTAGAAGVAGAAGAAGGLAGMGSVGAVGITHATAVVGLAAASVVAVLGVPAVELSIGEPAQAQPGTGAVAPADRTTSGESAGTSAEPYLETNDPLSTTEEALSTPVEAEGLDTSTSDPAVSGDLGVVSEDSAVPVTTDVAELAPDSTTGSTETPAPTPSSTAGPATADGTPTGTPSATPFGASGPAAENAQGMENWPGSDDGTSGPGRSDAVPGKSESSDPLGHSDGVGSATGGQPSAQPSTPPKPSQAADPGTRGQGKSARPAHAGGGRHKKM